MPAWSSFIAGKKAKLNIDFRGAEIDNVLKFFSMAAGVTISKDPALKGPVTIVNAKQLSLDGRSSWTLCSTPRAIGC